VAGPNTALLGSNWAILSQTGGSGSFLRWGRVCASCVPPARHVSSSNSDCRSLVSTSFRRSSLARTITGSSPKSWWNCWVALYSEDPLLTRVSVPAFESSRVAAKIPAPVRSTTTPMTSHGHRTATAAIRSNPLPGFTGGRLRGAY
jgi:hypothetical protein